VTLQEVARTFLQRKTETSSLNIASLSKDATEVRTHSDGSRTPHSGWSAFIETGGIEFS